MELLPLALQSSLAEKSGSAFGITGGYDFGGFEVLLGYRSETVEVELRRILAKPMTLVEH